MAKVNPILRVEIDPTQPVKEICEVISHVAAYNRSKEAQVLEEVKNALEKRLEQLKGAEKDAKPVREPDRDEQDQG